MSKDVWLVHGNWTGSGQHFVHYKSDSGRLYTKRYSNLENAKNEAKKIAIKQGIKNVGIERASGTWGRMRTTPTKRRKIRRSGSIFGNNPFNFRF